MSTKLLVAKCIAWLPFLLTVAMLSSCSRSNGGGSSGHHFVNSDGYNAEFRMEQAVLQLPTSYLWPRTAPGSVKDLSYQPRTGTSTADTYWFCAWERQWLDDQSGAASSAVERDLTFMQAVKHRELYLVASPAGDKKYYDDLLARARLGDPSQVARDVQLNCSPSSRRASH